MIAEHQSSDGVAGTFRAWELDSSVDRFDFYASRLRSAIHDLAQSSDSNLSDIPVIVSGMASSSLGMQEIAYASLPFPLDGTGVSSVIIPDFNGTDCPLILVSGVKSDNDVMRGEEAQLIGLYSLSETSTLDKSDSVLVFPGTHSKHMRVERGGIISFRTFMTGEVFNILSEFSILKDSISPGGDIHAESNKTAFISGVEASGTASLLNTLFTTRTNQLFSRFSKDQNAFYLSGLLIGNELNELCDESYSQLIICSGKHLYNQYKIASQSLNLTENITFIEPELIDKATIAGQVRVFRALIRQYE